MNPGYNPPDYMLDPPDDDVEDGEEIFDGPEPMTKAEREEEEAYWLNKPDSSGWAPSDFIYDPLSRKGFE